MIAELKARINHLQTSLDTQSFCISSQRNEIKECNKIIGYLKELFTIKNRLICELYSTNRIQKEKYEARLAQDTETIMDYETKKIPEKSIFADVQNRALAGMFLNIYHNIILTVFYSYCV